MNYEELYRRARERMTFDEMSVQEARERIQVALALALSNERAINQHGGGDSKVTELHAKFAADASAWVAATLNPEAKP